jgi:HEAT repeat protein
MSSKRLTSWPETSCDFAILLGEAFRRGAGEASDRALAQVALGLLAVACLVGSGLGVACYGAAKQVPQTPPSTGVKQEAAASDLPVESRKGDASVPIDPKLLAKLADQLRSKKWDERPAALTALEKLLPEKGAGKMDFGPVIEPLFDNCGWGGIGQRDAHRAEELIVRIGGQTGPTLRRRLGSPDAHDRRVAAELLARVEPAGASVTDLLRPLLADKDNFVRRAAMQGLGAQGPAAKAAISDLEKASADPNLDNRVTASVALIHIAGASDERVGALADFLRLKEPCDGAAHYAAWELGQFGRQVKSAAPQLLAALKHPDAQVRIYAAHALGSVGADPNKAVPALIGMLQDDPEREARRSAAGALGVMGPAAASAIPALREALRGDGGGWWVAADAIGKIGGPDAVAALIAALANKDDDVRLAAIRWLGKLGGADASAIEALQKARKDDPQEWNRKAAAEALKKITARPSPETFYGAAKQVPRTPPSTDVNRQTTPDLPSEPPKGDASVPIDPKLLAKLADQLRSKDWDERSAALTALEKLVPEKGAGKMDFRPVIEPLFDNCGWGGEAEENAERAEELIARIGGQAAPTLRRRLNVPDEPHRSVAVELLVRVEPPGPCGSREPRRPTGSTQKGPWSANPIEGVTIVL